MFYFVLQFWKEKVILEHLAKHVIEDVFLFVSLCAEISDFLALFWGEVQFGVHEILKLHQRQLTLKLILRMLLKPGSNINRVHQTPRFHFLKQQLHSLCRQREQRQFLLGQILRIKIVIKVLVEFLFGVGSIMPLVTKIFLRRSFIPGELGLRGVMHCLEVFRAEPVDGVVV